MCVEKSKGERGGATLTSSRRSSRMLLMNLINSSDPLVIDASDTSPLQSDFKTSTAFFSCSERPYIVVAAE